MPTELTINPELRDLLPPLSDEEFAGLEAEILKDGCTDRLTLWGDILVDGHHRYTICKKHNLPFKTKQKEFQNLDEAKLWIWQHQQSRRNATPFHRGEMALRFKDVIAEKAKSRQRGGQGGTLLVQNSAQAKRTRDILANYADISHDTLTKIEFLLVHADDATKAKLRSTKKETSIHQEYKRIKAEIDAKNPPKPRKPHSPKGSSKSKTTTAFETKHPMPPETPEEIPLPPMRTTEKIVFGDPKICKTYCCGDDIFEPDPDDEEFDWITKEEREELFERRKTCPNKLVPQIHNFTIQNIPEHKPDNLIRCLFKLFKTKYREKLLYALAREMRVSDGKELTDGIITNLYNEFRLLQ